MPPSRHYRRRHVTPRHMQRVVALLRGIDYRLVLLQGPASEEDREDYALLLDDAITRAWSFQDRRAA